MNISAMFLTNSGGVTKSARTAPRLTIASQAALSAFNLLLICMLSVAIPLKSSAAAQTIVSLTFDDGINQSQVQNILLSHGMKGTFYINSNLIGTGGGYLTKAELDALYADGNEIGGHTINHVDLATLSDAAQRAAICNDMQTLNTWYPGQIHSFAYPYASTGPTTQNILAAGCPGVGTYTSARTVGGLVSGAQCTGCPTAETIPPGNPYYISTPESILSTTTLDQIKTLVTQAETNGGWVPLVFHQVCSGCDPYSITAANLDAFLTWLQARQANSTYVRTVNQVMTVNIPAPPPPPQLGPNQLINPSLELDVNANGQADCWQRDSYGTNTATWARSTDAHTGSFSERVQVTAYSSGDLKLIPTLDAGQASGGCAPMVEAGASYQLGAWYKSTTPVIPVLFYRDSRGVWQYWRDGPLLPTSAGWAQMTFNPGVPPTGTQALSFGIAIDAVGTLTTDDYSMQKVLAVAPAPDTIAPTVSITAPAGGTVSGTISVSANAADNVGVAGVQFKLDGVNLAAEATASPYSISWNTATATNGTHTLTAVARDAAGNTTTSSAVTVTVSNLLSQNLISNPSLEIDANNNGIPDCWQFGGFGTNTFLWTRVTSAHSGNFAESLQITSRTSGDRKLVQTQDSGACAPAVTPGARYTLSTWYISTIPTGFVVYYRTSAGAWKYWTTSPSSAAATNWTQAIYTTPAIPAGATHLSFGLYLSTVGTLVTDDYAMTPAP